MYFNIIFYETFQDIKTVTEISIWWKYLGKTVKILPLNINKNRKLIFVITTIGLIKKCKKEIDYDREERALDSLI